MSACQNCDKFLHRCQAECCTCAPIESTRYRKHIGSVVRPVIDIVHVSPIFIVPITADGRCPFLTHELRCNIHNDRPFACEKFGDETHINMTCAYQTKDGQARSKSETERINNVQRWTQEKFLTKNK